MLNVERRADEEVKVRALRWRGEKNRREILDIAKFVFFFPHSVTVTLRSTTKESISRYKETVRGNINIRSAP